MHEHSLAKNLAELIFKEINKKNVKKVKSITFVIGEASGIEQEFLEHSFKEHIFKGTELENCRLVFKNEKPKIKCKNCGCEYEDVVVKCNCGGIDFDIVAGNSVYIESIEFE